MLCGLAAFVGLDWARAPAWLLALAAGALGFAAMGVAIGGLAREVRAASLLAFLLSLPIAFLALIPSGAVAERPVRRDQRHQRPVPVQADAAGARRRDQRWRDRHAAAASLALTAAFAVLARLALRRFG